MKNALCAAALLLAVPAGGASKEGEKVQARVIGQPVRTANTISYVTAPGYGPEGHDLLCWVTTAESGAHFYALDLKTDRLVVKPLNHLEGYPILPASDGCIYVGSTTSEVMRYRPATEEWSSLALVFPDLKRTIRHVRAMSEGRDGWLYCGSCFGQRARVNMATGEVQALPALAEPGSWYVAAVQALPDGRVAFGLGHRARVVIYDPAQGKDVGQWLPQSWTSDGFAITLSAGRSVLIVTHFPSGRRGAMDCATGEWLGEAPWPLMKTAEPWSVWFHSSGYGSAQDYYLLPGTDTAVACDGKQVFQWDPKQPALPSTIPLRRFRPRAPLALAMRYSIDTEGDLWTHDARRTKVEQVKPVPQPPVARGLFGLGVGPDGCIYGGAYQSMQLFRYDPRADLLSNLGNHNPGWSGETYSFAVRGRELIACSYTNGAVVAYDPAKPWDCTVKGRKNPRRLGFFGQRVYRPYSTAVASDGRIWSVGAAGWGSTGGGIAWLDAETGKTHATALPGAPSDILALPGNELLVSDHGRFVWWDGLQDRPIAEAALPAAAAGNVLLSAAPVPRVAFCSDRKVIVASLPEPGKVVVEATHEGPVPAVHLQPYSRGVVVGGAQGFAALDLTTGRFRHFCDAGLGIRYAFVVHDDVVYFTQGASLLSVRIPAD